MIANCMQHLGMIDGIITELPPFEMCECAH